MNQHDIPQPVWITTNAELANSCQQWLNEPFLALDTEFIRTNTFYPIAGLFQVADSQHSYLIDPLEIDEWQPFADLLTHPNVIKVFHACPEDLEVCRRLTGVLPSPLADTQIAAALAGLGSNLGFQKLLEEILDIHLPKEETRSNWLQRPLSDNQVIYAVADVHFLYQLYPKLVSMLQTLGRDEWLMEDCQRLLLQSDRADQPEYYFKRFKQKWKMKAQQLFLLQELSLWREHKARLENVPRNNVIDTNSLWNMAFYKAQTKEQIIQSGVKPYLVRKYKDELIPLIENRLTVGQKKWPPLAARPLSVGAGKLYKAIKKTVKSTADTLNIPAELLAGKKSLEALLRSGYPDGTYELPPGLLGWREAVIGHKLLDQLEATQAMHTESQHDENIV